jgi:hypothetical protein
VDGAVKDRDFERCQPGENAIEIAVTNVCATGWSAMSSSRPDMLWQACDPNFHSGYSLKEFPD